METESVSSLIDFIYPSVNSNPPPLSDYFLCGMILAPRNGDVDSINEEVLSRMTGEAVTYHSADAIVTEAGADSPDTTEENLSIEVL
jgi:PIF1-like helicase